jgi:hypothetical protein
MHSRAITERTENTEITERLPPGLATYNWLPCLVFLGASPGEGPEPTAAALATG